MAIASAVSVSATCIGDDMLLHGISADGGVGNIRDRSLALGPGNMLQRDTVELMYKNHRFLLPVTQTLVQRSSKVQPKHSTRDIPCEVCLTPETVDDGADRLVVIPVASSLCGS